MVSTNGWRSPSDCDIYTHEIRWTSVHVTRRGEERDVARVESDIGKDESESCVPGWV